MKTRIMTAKRLAFYTRDTGDPDTTGLIQSRDEEAVMAVASGREIEAREWPQKESTDRRELSATQVAR